MLPRAGVLRNRLFGRRLRRNLRRALNWRQLKLGPCGWNRFQLGTWPLCRDVMRCGARRCNGQKLQVGELVRRDIDTRLLQAKLGLRRMHNDLWIDLRIIPANCHSVFRDAESSQRSGETERRRERFDEIHPGLCRGRRRLKQLKRIRRGWWRRLADRRAATQRIRASITHFTAHLSGGQNVSGTRSIRTRCALSGERTATTALTFRDGIS